MRISKFVHSCLLVEKGGDRLLFDPGKFSFVEGRVKPEQFTGIASIVLTHFHPDHVETEALKKILSGNAGAVVLTNTEAQKKLAEAGVLAEVFETGTRDVGGFRLTALAATHAPILGSAAPQNTAYVVDDMLLNPGDSFAEILSQKAAVHVLALPVMAPWSTELGVADFVKRMRPQRIVPVHDGQAKDFFLKQRYDVFEKYFSEQGIRFERMMGPGSSFEI
jgi:L-ascorbate metabolism protein UlaG (beta-lactamase superfamily)